jgi:hypothetical protein
MLLHRCTFSDQIWHNSKKTSGGGLDTWNHAWSRAQANLFPPCLCKKGIGIVASAEVPRACADGCNAVYECITGSLLQTKGKCLFDCIACLVRTQMYDDQVAGFHPTSVMGFVVDRMALEQIFFKYFGFPCHFCLHELLHIY